MDVYFLFVTAVTVSVDSLLAGVALGADGKKGIQKKIFSVMTIVSLLAVSFTQLGYSIFAHGEIAIKIGGLILSILGAHGLIMPSKNDVFARKRELVDFYHSLLTGVGVGMDGACASLSLTLLGYEELSPISVIIFHYFFMELGVTLSFLGIKKAEGSQRVSSALLLLLGLYKIII